MCHDQGRPAANELDRNFTVTVVNKKWVSDVTYISTAVGWLYLTSVIDLCNRKVVGWAMGESNDTVLTLSALYRALDSNNPPEGPVHNRHGGSNHTAKNYKQALTDRGIDCSVSHKGNCWDNALAENFLPQSRKS